MSRESIPTKFRIPAFKMTHFQNKFRPLLDKFKEMGLIFTQVSSNEYSLELPKDGKWECKQGAEFLLARPWEISYTGIPGQGPKKFFSSIIMGSQVEFDFLVEQKEVDTLLLSLALNKDKEEKDAVMSKEPQENKHDVAFSLPRKENKEDKEQLMSLDEDSEMLDQMLGTAKKPAAKEKDQKSADKEVKIKFTEKKLDGITPIKIRELGPNELLSIEDFDLSMVNKHVFDLVLAELQSVKEKENQVALYKKFSTDENFILEFLKAKGVGVTGGIAKHRETIEALWQHGAFSVLSFTNFPLVIKVVLEKILGLKCNFVICDLSPTFLNPPKNRKFTVIQNPDAPEQHMVAIVTGLPRLKNATKTTSGHLQAVREIYNFKGPNSSILVADDDEDQIAAFQKEGLTTLHIDKPDGSHLDTFSALPFMALDKVAPQVPEPKRQRVDKEAKDDKEAKKDAKRDDKKDEKDEKQADYTFIAMDEQVQVEDLKDAVDFDEKSVAVDDLPLPEYKKLHAQFGGAQDAPDQMLCAISLEVMEDPIRFYGDIFDSKTLLQTLENEIAINGHEYKREDAEANRGKGREEIPVGTRVIYHYKRGYPIKLQDVKDWVGRVNALPEETGKDAEVKALKKEIGQFLKNKSLAGRKFNVPDDVKHVYFPALRSKYSNPLLNFELKDRKDITFQYAKGGYVGLVTPSIDRKEQEDFADFLKTKLGAQHIQEVDTKILDALKSEIKPAPRTPVHVAEIPPALVDMLLLTPDRFKEVLNAVIRGDKIEDVLRSIEPFEWEPNALQGEFYDLIYQTPPMPIKPIDEAAEREKWVIANLTYMHQALGAPAPDFEKGLVGSFESRSIEDFRYNRVVFDVESLIKESVQKCKDSRNFKLNGQANFQQLLAPRSRVFVEESFLSEFNCRTHGVRPRCLIQPEGVRDGKALFRIEGVLTRDHTRKRHQVFLLDQSESTEGLDIQTVKRHGLERIHIFLTDYQVIDNITKLHKFFSQWASLIGEMDVKQGSLPGMDQKQAGKPEAKGKGPRPRYRFATKDGAVAKPVDKKAGVIGGPVDKKDGAVDIKAGSDGTPSESTIEEFVKQIFKYYDLEQNGHLYPAKAAGRAGEIQEIIQNAVRELSAILRFVQAEPALKQADVINILKMLDNNNGQVPNRQNCINQATKMCVSSMAMRAGQTISVLGFGDKVEGFLPPVEANDEKSLALLARQMDKKPRGRVTEVLPAMREAALLFVKRDKELKDAALRLKQSDEKKDAKERTHKSEENRILMIFDGAPTDKDPKTGRVYTAEAFARACRETLRNVLAPAGLELPVCSCIIYNPDPKEGSEARSYGVAFSKAGGFGGQSIRCDNEEDLQTLVNRLTTDSPPAPVAWKIGEDPIVTFADQPFDKVFEVKLEDCIHTGGDDYVLRLPNCDEVPFKATQKPSEQALALREGIARDRDFARTGKYQDPTTANRQINRADISTRAGLSLGLADLTPRPKTQLAPVGEFAMFNPAAQQPGVGGGAAVNRMRRRRNLYRLPGHG